MISQYFRSILWGPDLNLVLGYFPTFLTQFQYIAPRCKERSRYFFYVKLSTFWTKTKLLCWATASEILKYRRNKWLMRSVIVSNSPKYMDQILFPYQSMCV